MAEDEVVLSLREYEAAFRKFTSDAIHELARAKDAVFRQIRIVPAETVSASTYTMEDGTKVSLDTTPVEMAVNYTRSEVMAGDFESVYVALDSAADQLLAQIMPSLFAHVSQLAEAAGNTISTGGEPFTYDHILQMLEKLPIEFDEDGMAHMPTVVTGPGDFLDPPTPEQTRRLNELLGKKKGEFDARRRRRQLP